MIAQLDTKTVYSFMESVVSIEKYVQMAKECGYSHLAIMDVDNLYGAYHFLEATRKHDIQPLIGLEMTLVKDEDNISLRYLALSTKGYQELMKLSTLKMTGRKNWSDFTPHLEDVAIIVPYFEGIEQLDLGYDYYIGVSPDTPQEVFTRPILPLYQVNSFEKEDIQVLQILSAVKDNVSLREVDVHSQQGIFLPASDLEARFKNRFPQALVNLQGLIENVDYQLDPSLKLPRFNPERPAVEELRERAEKGLSDKGLTSAIYRERLNEELAVIHDMGFDDYFLVVWDLLRFGRSQGYYMGMGRGSAVGSLVAYSLDITGIDPVEKNLIFERFLNRERYTMPDIDIDIQTFIGQNSFVMFVIAMVVNTWRRLSLIRPLGQNRQFVMF